MWKKVLLLASGIGLLFVILFVLINPSLLGHSVIPKYLSSDYSVVKIQMFSYFLLAVGISLSLCYFILKKFSESTILKQILWFLSIIGIVIIILSLIFSPDYLVEKFTKLNFLREGDRNQLFQYQIITLTLGSVTVFLSLLVYIIKYSKKKILYVAVQTILGLIIYFILFYFVFINVKYPSNILLNSDTYSKVKQLILGQNILLSDFDPISTLKVKRKIVTKAKYPVVDMNFHMKSAYKTEEDRKLLSPENLVKSMDSVGLQIIVNTDGFRANIDEHIKKYPDRFIMFDPTGFPPQIMSDQDFADLPIKLEDKVNRGARGDGEIWKHLGLRTRDKTGKIISVDDPRIDPFWSKAGELDIPILWHMIDVPANFQPIDKNNERYIMLSSYPEFSHYDPGTIPNRDSVIKDRENVIRKHPNTTFIGCHMGMNANDLSYVSYMLDTFPNYYVEISTVLSELGRQPFTAREFFIKYQDRILFGTDGGSLFGVDGWSVEQFYQAHWEFLETDNEYIKYPMQGAINQGSWRIYGINLPDTVLQKIYYKNAEKILKIRIDY